MVDLSPLFVALLAATALPNTHATCIGSPCPVGYYWCQAGPAFSDCRPSSAGAFPTVDCASQCLTGAATPITPDPCTSTQNQQSSCPQDGHYYLCVQGNAANGCMARATGPFPAADCSSQCLTAPRPAACPATQPSACSQTGLTYYLCTDGSAANRCRLASLGPFDSTSCAAQCLTAGNCPVPAPANSCPQDGRAYYLCTEGLEKDGCREAGSSEAAGEGPHYEPVDCTWQCLLPSPTSATSPLPSPSPSPSPSPVPSPSPSPVPSLSPSPAIITQPTPSPSPTPRTCPSVSPLPACQSQVIAVISPTLECRLDGSPLTVLHPVIQVLSGTGTTVTLIVRQYFKCSETLSWMDVYLPAQAQCLDVNAGAVVPWGAVAAPATITAQCSLGVALVDLFMHETVDKASGAVVDLSGSIPVGCQCQALSGVPCATRWPVICHPADPSTRLNRA